MIDSRLVITIILFCAQSTYCQQDSIILWPGKVPGEIAVKTDPVMTSLADGTTRVISITNPFLAVFTPDSAKNNRKAMVVCPGGGYVRLAVEKEGYAIARWLTSRGYTVFVLQYRVPDKRDGASQDLTRAVKWIRYHASEYGIKADRVGAMGFSAGAHLVVRSVLADSLPGYTPQDHSDYEPGRPDCMVILYPAYLSGGPDDSLTPGLSAKSSTVNTFIFQTMDDGLALSALALAKALQQSKTNVELHMLPIGGHGYGMVPGNKAAETWPVLLDYWLKDHF